jgi:hypothetical protein
VLDRKADDLVELSAGQKRGSPVPPEASEIDRLLLDFQIRDCWSRCAQLELNHQSHYIGAIGGIIGPDTQGALQRSQQPQTLTRSGVLDNATFGKLSTHS